MFLNKKKSMSVLTEDPVSFVILILTFNYLCYVIVLAI